MNNNNQEKSNEADVYVIRKLLEQIHNYFEYLDCPFYNSEMSERDLLLMVIQPSMKRYRLLEWMLTRLEPDIDFYLQKKIDDEEIIESMDDKKDTIDAIAFLKNLGLSYSRVIVPDIIHGKVGPLIQLKFLVRLLRVIRLKSWNKKPIRQRETYKSQIEKLNQTSNEVDETEPNDVNNENDDNDNIGKSKDIDEKINYGDLFEFINHKIKNNITAKTFLSALELRLSEDQLNKFKQKLYLKIMERLKVSVNKTNEIYSSKQLNIENCDEKEQNINDIKYFEALEIDRPDVSFGDGMIQLITDEILAPKYNKLLHEESLYSSNIDGESCCSLSLHQPISYSGATSRCSGDEPRLANIGDYQEGLDMVAKLKADSSNNKNNFITTAHVNAKTSNGKRPWKNSYKQNHHEKHKQQVIIEENRNNTPVNAIDPYLTCLNSDKNFNSTECHGDDCPQPKPRNCMSKVHQDVINNELVQY